MENNTEKKEYVLAFCAVNQRFELEEELMSFEKAVIGHDYWKNVASPGGDALVIHQATMTIHYPERLKGKKIEFYDNKRNINNAVAVGGFVNG
jgi:hypothetical protein